MTDTKDQFKERLIQYASYLEGELAKSQAPPRENLSQSSQRNYSKREQQRGVPEEACRIEATMDYASNVANALAISTRQMVLDKILSEFYEIFPELKPQRPINS